MGKYIKLFNDEQSHKEYMKTCDYVMPNVSLCKNSYTVKYNPPEDMVIYTLDIPSQGTMCHMFVQYKEYSDNNKCDIYIDGNKMSMSDFVIDTNHASSEWENVYAINTLSAGEHELIIENNTNGNITFDFTQLEYVSKILSSVPPRDVVSFDKNTLTSLRAIDGLCGYNAMIWKDGTLTLGCNTSTIGEGIVKIEGSAFADLTGITEVTLPQSIEYIYSNAFNGCTSLSSITVPDKYVEGGYYIFNNTAWYNSQPDNSALYIGKHLISVKGNVETLDISPSAEYIGLGKIVRNGTVKYLTIPDSIETIPDSFAAATSKLETVTIGSGVTRIGSWAFGANYNHLKTVTIAAPTPPEFYGTTYRDLGVLVFDYVSGSDYVFDPNLKIYVPSASLNAYKTADGWSRYASIIYPIE